MSTPPIQLIPLQTDDRALLQHLLEGGRDYFQALGEEHMPPDMAERMLLEAAHLGNRHLMAIQWEETPVGVLDFRLRYPDAAAAYLGLILLLPEWRGRGIGTWALDIWETWLDVQTPLERVRTAVPAHLRRAQRFFLRRDYHLTGESYRVPVGEARPRLLVMEKLLGIEPPAEEP